MTQALFHSLTPTQKAQLGSIFTVDQLRWLANSNKIAMKNPFSELYIEPTQEELRNELCEKVTEKVVQAWKGTRERLEVQKQPLGIEGNWRSKEETPAPRFESHWKKKSVVHKNKKTGSDRENWRVRENTDHGKRPPRVWVKKS